VYALLAPAWSGVQPLAARRARGRLAPARHFR